jgi:hypothetical protein
MPRQPIWSVERTYFYCIKTDLDTSSKETQYWNEMRPCQPQLFRRSHAKPRSLESTESLTTKSRQHTILSIEEAQELSALLANQRLWNLSETEVHHLRVLIETHVYVDSQRRALDNNGTRFMTSVKSFAITQALTSPESSRAPSPTTRSLPVRGRSGARIPQIRFRDVLWGFHSESQEILLSTCEDVCGRPMLWEDAKTFCLPLWLRSNDILVRSISPLSLTHLSATLILLRRFDNLRV